MTITTLGAVDQLVVVGSTMMLPVFAMFLLVFGEKCYCAKSQEADR
jgi:hypothetical protein